MALGCTLTTLSLASLDLVGTTVCSGKHTKKALLASRAWSLSVLHSVLHRPSQPSSILAYPVPILGRGGVFFPVPRRNSSRPQTGRHVATLAGVRSLGDWAHVHDVYDFHGGSRRRWKLVLVTRVCFCLPLEMGDSLWYAAARGTCWTAGSWM